MLVLTGIGFACAAIIYCVHIVLPHRVQGLEKTEEIANTLPGMNCGACGYPGCFAYAQALTKNPDLMSESPCAVMLQDAEGLERLGKILGISIDAAGMSKRALIHCSGNSEVIYDYSGVRTCKAAAQLLKGYKKCPYACLGLGDCLEVCPQSAIYMDEEKEIAVVDAEECTGCGLCVAECPQKLIELVPEGTKIAFLCNYKPLKNIPGREKCDFGCIHCRKCYKACEFEAVVWNKERAIPEFDIEKCTLCRKCMDECPNDTLADFTRVKTAAQAL